jgi:Uma2 family endonuclease
MTKTEIFLDPVTQEVIYPEIGEQPTAKSTAQYNLITMLKSGIDAMFAERDDVFCAADLFWYPVEGNSGIRLAPDVMVAFGRPPGDRSSYLQWKEGNISPHVVIEIVSPGNTPSEMMDKLEFYDYYGVEEYYSFDPQKQKFNAWHRQNKHLQYLYEQKEWHSPRLGVTFTLELAKGSAGYGLLVTRNDGTRFETIAEIRREWKAAQKLAEVEKRRAEQERIKAEQEKIKAEQEKIKAEQEKTRAEALAAKLRALGINPDDIA